MLAYKLQGKAVDPITHSIQAGEVPQVSPVIVDQEGDVSVYASLRDAVFDMETIDIEHGVYVVADLEGNELVLQMLNNKLKIETRRLEPQVEERLKAHLVTTI